MTKIHKILKFERLIGCIDFNTDKTKHTTNSSEKDFFKLMDKQCLWQNNGTFKKKNKC